MTRRALQLVHSAKPPFLDVARSYERHFDGSGIELVTHFLTGPGSLGFSSGDLRGLKRDAIRRVRELAGSCELVVAQRYKPIYIAGHLDAMPVLGVHHQEGDYRRWHRRRFVRRRADRIALLGVSNAVRDDLRADLPGVRAETLHNALDADALRARLLDRSEARSELGLEPDRTWLGCVARLHPIKDHATLLHGFARGPRRNYLALVGTGPLDAELRELARELGVQERVRFCGEIPDAARLFRAFDAFVLASRREGFGLVLLEAMAAGLLVIASDSLLEVVGDAGRLFATANPDALAAALEEPLEPDLPRIAAQLERFSPATIRAQFWSLPFLAAILHNAPRHGDAAAGH